MDKVVELTDDKITLKEFANYLEGKYSPEELKQMSDKVDEQIVNFNKNDLSADIFIRSIQVVKLMKRYLFLKDYSMIMTAACNTMNFYEETVDVSKFTNKPLNVDFYDEPNKDTIIQNMLNEMEIFIENKDLENYFYNIMCLTFCH